MDPEPIQTAGWPHQLGATGIGPLTSQSRSSGADTARKSGGIGRAGGTTSAYSMLVRLSWLPVGLALLLGGCQQASGTVTQTVTASAPATEAASPEPGTADSAAITPQSPSASQVSSTPELVLGPKGLGELRLGMNKDAARETGLVSHVMGSQGTCAGDNNDGWLKAAGKPGPEDSVGMLAFSTSSDRLVAIYAYGGIATPEGIALGSSKKEVRRAYPGWMPAEGASQGLGLVPVPGNSEASYGIWVEHGVVVELDLELANHDCWG